MNGRYKFVLGLKSKHVVSEQALRECNMTLFPAKYQAGATGASAEAVTGELHPIYTEEYEQKLMCPITNTPFGRPILLYPGGQADIKRAKDYVEATSKKRKKDKKDKSEKSNTDKTDSKDGSMVPPKKSRKSSCSSNGGSKNTTPSSNNSSSPWEKKYAVGATPARYDVPKL